jgi:hypothetical protein
MKGQLDSIRPDSDDSHGPTFYGSVQPVLAPSINAVAMAVGASVLAD